MIMPLLGDNILSGMLCNHDLEDAEKGRTKAINRDNLLCLLVSVFVVFAFP